LFLFTLCLHSPLIILFCTRAAPKPVESQYETAAVQFLGLLFLLILIEGVFLAGSGFLPDALDEFARTTVYSAFSPTLGVFLAGSTAYGLWKTRENKEQK
jgi:threonine/homoserine/homoserine lactone efflux protein